MRTRSAALLLLALACAAQAAEPGGGVPLAALAQAPALPPLHPWPNDEPREVKVRNDLLSFVYSWPIEAFSIPKLNAHFEAEAARAKAQALATAREDKTERGKDAPFGRHESSTVWKVVSDHSRFLSLAAEIDIFVG